jgi:hypothetical protein
MDSHSPEPWQHPCVVYRARAPLGMHGEQAQPLVRCRMDPVQPARDPGAALIEVRDLGVSELAADLRGEPAQPRRALLGLLAVEAVDSPLPVEEAASKLGRNLPFLDGVVGGMQTKFGRDAVPFERVTAQGRKAFRIDAETAARLRDLLGLE